MPKQIALFLSLCAFLLAPQAQAYVGPGLGAGAIAVVVGVIGSLFLAIFSVLYYPIKRRLKRRKTEQSEDDEDEQEKQEEATG